MEVALPLQSAMGDVAAVLHAIKADAADGLIGAGDGRLQAGAAGGDTEDAATGGDDTAIGEAGAGVEDLDAVEGVGALQSGDGLAGLIGAGIAARGHDDADAGVGTPAEDAIAEAS